jgi:hypothetical protein
MKEIVHVYHAEPCMCTMQSIAAAAAAAYPASKPKLLQVVKPLELWCVHESYKHGLHEIGTCGSNGWAD